MAKFNFIHNSFLAGEVSPKYFGRSETQEYFQALEKCENAIIYPEGGAAMRGGTQFKKNLTTDIAAVPTVTGIKFLGSDGRRFILILANGNGTYFAQNWRVYDVQSDTFLTITAPGGGDTTDTYWELTGYDIGSVQYAQSGDTMFLVRTDKDPLVLKRTGTLAFTLEYYTGQKYRQVDGLSGVGGFGDADAIVRNSPFLGLNTDPDGVFRAIQITSTNSPTNTTFDITDDTGLTRPFGSDALLMVGSIIKFNTGSATFAVAITGSAAGKLTGKLMRGTFVAGPHYGFGYGTNTYELSAWNNANGWPRAVAFFEQRAVFGGSTRLPDTLWFSQTSDIYEMMRRKFEDDATAAADSDPFSGTLNSNILTLIQWISAGKTLTVGTETNEFLAGSSDPTKAVSLLTFQSQAQTIYGSAYIQAERVENTTLFVQRSKQKLREFVYSFDEDSYKAQDLLYRSHHLFTRVREKDPTLEGNYVRGGIKKIAFQEADHGILWCLDNNGVLFGMTRDKNLNITAWHYHEIAGSLTILGATTVAQVLSIVVLPSVGNEHDDLYVFVARTINGNYQITMEKIGREFESLSLDNDTDIPFYLDSCVVKNSITDTVTGLTHLIGEEVDVVTDGIYNGRYTVDGSGGIEITENPDNAWATVIVGLPYEATIKPLGPEAGGVLGSAQGTTQQVDQVTVRFNRTVGGQYGYSEDDMFDVDFGPNAQAQDEPIPLFSGLFPLQMPPTLPNQMSQPILKQTRPFPWSVTCIIQRGVTNEG